MKFITLRSSFRGLRSRLLSITLIPIIGIFAWAGVTTAVRMGQVHKSSEVSRRVLQLGRLLEARVALDRERLPTQANLWLSDYRVLLSDGMIKQILGFNPETEIARVRPLSDTAMRATRLPGISDDLRELRKVSDSSSTLDKPIQLFRRLYSKLQSESDRELLALNQLVAGLDREHELSRTVETLLAAESTADASGEEMEMLFSLLSTNDESRPLRADLASARSQRLHGTTLVLRYGSPKVRAFYEKMVRAPSYAAAGKLVDNLLSNPPHPRLARNQPPSTLFGVGKDFVQMLDRSENARQMLSVAVTEAGVLSKDIHSATQRALTLTVSLAMFMGLLSVIIALILSRSISAPLLSLANRATEISAGSLTTTRLAERGPNEIVRVTRAMNDLVDNLALLNRQSSALASGELSNPVLAQPLPGGLGVSIQETVARLQSSIRNREDLQHRLTHQATHDELTGLANRKSLTETLARSLARSQRRASPLSVLFIDLDGFKKANDAFGHRFGDEVLRVCADRIRHCLRNGDFAARLGGDEFVVILEDLEDPALVFPTADRYIAALSVPVTIDDRTVSIGASIGIATDMDATATPTSILRDADLAVYRAKATGRGHAEVFDAGLRVELEERADIETAIVIAMSSGELHFVYQPLVQRVDGGSEVKSVEALLRWERAGRGFVSPAHFIPLLEESPKIVELGRWVLRTAMSEIAALQRSEGVGVDVSINVSPRHLVASGFVNDVVSALQSSGLDPARLILEITETSILEDTSVVTDHLRQLRQLGIRVALDDFGTGYTSIRQLGVLPVDILKIDRSYVNGLSQEADRAIVEMMIGVGRTLGLVVVAEGVQTPTHAQQLEALDCTVHQGFLYYEPMIASKLAGELRLGATLERPTEGQR